MLNKHKSQQIIDNKKNFKELNKENTMELDSFKPKLDFNTVNNESWLDRRSNLG